MAQEAAQLAVSVLARPNGVVVRPEGELDHDTAGSLREALDSVVARAPARIVVDCGGLEFCDSTGLNLLLRARLGAEDTGTEFVLAAPGAVVGRMLEITGADEVFRVHATVDEALTDGSADGGG